MTPAQIRDALMRVLAAAMAERNEHVTLHDCACWLLYAATRVDAAAQVEEGEAPRNWSAKRELAETAEASFEGGDNIWDDVAAIARDLDPDFTKPIRGQDLWGVS